MAITHTPATEPSERLKTVLAAIQAYNDWEISEIVSIRSPTCIHEILPRSINHAVFDNKGYEAYLLAITPYFRKFKVVINDIFEDEKANKVVVWAKSTAETDLGPYKNEYMYMFYLDENGEKVDRFLEFVDSSSSLGFWPRLKQYIEEKAGEGT